MQQFIESQHSLQQEQIIEILSQGRDFLGVLPVGKAWFEIFPLEILKYSKSLMVAIYPNESLLNNHVFRLKQMGQMDGRFESLTSQMPPHTQRAVFERIQRKEVSLLMITAKKLQTVNTLTQLIRHPFLGPLIIEQGHWVVPSLWGPVVPHPYGGLVNLFQQQWPGRPPLFVFSHFLPLQYEEAVINQFSLRCHSPMRFLAATPSPTVRVERHITQYQKLKKLEYLVQNAIVRSSSATILLCHSLKDVFMLQKRLSAYISAVFHRDLEPQEKELLLMKLILDTNPFIIIETSMLSELPIHLWPYGHLQIIYWQMPWSCESLAQHLLVSTRYEKTAVEGVILYAKEDYQSQKQWLISHYSGENSLKSIEIDQLNRMRHFCRQSTCCRRVQLMDWLHCDSFSQVACGLCDVCQNPHNSSRWRNILDLFRY